MHPVLSVASSKRPSGVAAELERDLVAELGDAAMAEAFGETARPYTKGSLFPTVGQPEPEKCEEGRSLLLIQSSLICITSRGYKLFGVKMRCGSGFWFKVDIRSSESGMPC